MDGFQRHHHLDGGAVGVGDDVGLARDGVGVDFGDDQRHVLFHAPGRAVVYDEGALFGKTWSILLRCRRPRREDGDVGALFDGLLHADDLMGLALEYDFLAHRALRGGHNQFVDTNFLFVKDLKHL